MSTKSKSPENASPELPNTFIKVIVFPDCEFLVEYADLALLSSFFDALVRTGRKLSSENDSIRLDSISAHAFHFILQYFDIKCQNLDSTVLSRKPVQDILFELYHVCHIYLLPDCFREELDRILSKSRIPFDYVIESLTFASSARYVGLEAKAMDCLIRNFGELNAISVDFLHLSRDDLNRILRSLNIGASEDDILMFYQRWMSFTYEGMEDRSHCLDLLAAIQPALLTHEGRSVFKSLGGRQPHFRKPKLFATSRFLRPRLKPRHLRHGQLSYLAITKESCMLEPAILLDLQNGKWHTMSESLLCEYEASPISRTFDWHDDKADVNISFTYTPRVFREKFGYSTDGKMRLGEALPRGTILVLPDELLIIGGNKSRSSKACYTLRPDGLIELPSLSQARSQHSVLEYSSVVMVTGGVSDTGPTDSVEILTNEDITAWRPGPPLISARFDHGSAVLRGQFYVCGGLASDDTGLHSVEVFSYRALQDYLTNPSRTTTWTVIEPCKYVHRGFSLVADTTYLYAVGGSGCSAIERFRPHNGRWVTIKREKFLADPTPLTVIILKPMDLITRLVH